MRISWSELFFLIIRQQPKSTLFPYTTLFRSSGRNGVDTNAVLAARFEREHAGVALERGFRRRHATAVTGNDALARDRKSTRLNSSHVEISYAVFCLKKKNHEEGRCNTVVVDR